MCLNFGGLNFRLLISPESKFFGIFFNFMHYSGLCNTITNGKLCAYMQNKFQGFCGSLLKNKTMMKVYTIMVHLLFPQQY